MKTFLLIGFILLTLNVISCGQKGDLIRPQSAEQQTQQNETAQSNKPDEPDKAKK